MKNADKVQIVITPQSVFLVIGILLLIGLIYKLTAVLYIFFLAFSIYSTLKPIINKLEKKYNINKTISIPLILGSFLIFLSLLIGLVVQNISIELRNIDFEQLTSNFIDVLEERVPFINNPEEDVRMVDNTVVDSDNKTNGFLNSGLLTGSGSFIIQFLSNTAGIVLSIFTIFVVAYYMLLKKSNIFEGVLKFIPNTNTRATIRKYIHKVEGKLGSWLMTQSLLMLIIGVLSYLGVMLPSLIFAAESYKIGRFAVTLAVISGILEVVPNIGPIVTFLVAIFLSIALGGEYIIPQTLYIGVLFFIVQQIEAAFIAPRLIKQTVGLDPIVTVLGVIAGGTLGGPIGAILIIPVIATIQIIIEFFVKEEEIFVTEPPKEEPEIIQTSEKLA